MTTYNVSRIVKPAAPMNVMLKTILRIRQCSRLLTMVLALAISGSCLTASAQSSDPSPNESADLLFSADSRDRTERESASETQPQFDLLQADSTERQRLRAELGEDRIRSIYDRIDLLKKVIAQKKVERELSRDAEASSAPIAGSPPLGPPLEGMPTPDSSPASEGSPASDSSSSKAAVEVKDPTTDASGGQTSEEVVGSEVATQGPIAKPMSSAGTLVFNEPVDQWELANSLYMTGNFESAIKNYRAALATGSLTPQESAWVRCLIGCCQRQAGDAVAAETIFREVANEKTGAYPVDFARWRLKQISQRVETERAFESVESEIDQFLEKRNGKK